MLNRNINNMELRSYQNEIKDKSIKILKQFKIVYLSMEVRTGKTITSIAICNDLTNPSREDHRPAP